MYYPDFFSNLAQLTAMNRGLKNCYNKMGALCLFSPRVPLILSVFSKLRVKCWNLDTVTTFKRLLCVMSQDFWVEGQMSKLIKTNNNFNTK